jgi:hypothetical protein
VNDTVHISAAPPARTSMNYSALREGGMEWIRLWAKESWTDHNVHDPGITLLEAFSYAMTELGLRLNLDVADLLRSGEAHAEPQLEPAHRVLPSGPVNAADLRRVLLDHPLVSDVQIFQPASSEVAFYELPGGNPPLTYTAGTPRVRPDGLYEVLVELSQGELNSNTYASQVVFDDQTYDIEIALPFWDDPEAAPFRQPATAMTSISMILDNGVAWRPLPEEQTYYGRLNIAYTDANATPGSIESWALLRITTQLIQPGAVLPGILDEAQAAVQANTAAGPVPRFALRARGAAIGVEELRSYLSGWRNLGEQAVRIGLARVQDVSVRARLEVSGGIDIEKLLARIFMDIDAELTPRVRFRSLAERRAAEADSADLFEGPLLRRGFLGGGDNISYPRVIYSSDILRIIMRRRSGEGGDVVTQENPAGRDIVAVTNLALGNFINNRPITVGAVDCLHLVEIERFLPRLSIAKSRIVCVRNDSVVSYDLSRVQALYDELQAQSQAVAVTADPSPIWPVVPGEAMQVQDYVPLQNELPATFGVGEAELPDSAGPERHAAVKQLQGYLFMFEQLLGDVTAQLGNINRFFSADAGDTPSYFVRRPFELPGAQSLLRRFPAGEDWKAFIADPDNPVLGALRDAVESRERLLDRRNRMLDHLLARQGEDAAALGQEMHRWARAELLAASLPPAQQEARIAERREAANARLLRHKAVLLRDSPELNALRLLANSNRLMADASLLRVEPVSTGFRWHLSAGGPELLRGMAPAASGAAAAIAGERAMVLAGRASNYTVLNLGGGQHQLNLMDGNGTGAGALAIGESEQIFASPGAANTALAAMALEFSALRLESSASPFERKVAHQSGIRDTRRRRALRPTNEFFEIIDDPPGGGLFGKRWELHELSGNAGAVLLVSPIRYEAPADPQAIALAEQGIRQVLRYGLDEWNYQIVPAGGNTFQLELRDPAGVVFARLQTALATSADARGALDAIVAHLYSAFGAERMHLVEHLLLRPRLNGDTLLSLPEGETARERDPYSQRISLVLPSGFARDFSLTPATATLIKTTPDRFREPEFRRHFAGMVGRDCPAHLSPTIYWVDRQALGTPPSNASFDTFEARYFDWLDSVLIPGADPAAIGLARNRLVEALNAIADDAA